MLVGYCVRREGEPGPGAELAGVGSVPVRLLEGSGIGVWVSDGVAGKPTLERIREHDGVVRAALRSATPLPLRFGTHFRDEEELRDTLRRRGTEFLNSLERVAGCVEIGVRIAWPDGPAAPEGGEGRPPAVRTGREFLQMRKAELEREAEDRLLAGQIAEMVEQCFAALNLPTVRMLNPERAVAATLAHLVHRNYLKRYRICADEARAALPRLHLRLTGPWAPYSFV